MPSQDSEQDNSNNLISIKKLCSCIQLTGENCIGFLNNLLISDLTTFVADTFYYTGVCNPKGRLISSLWLKINPNFIQIICPSTMQQQLLQFFNMRKFRLKIEITAEETPISINHAGKIVTDTDMNSLEANNHDRFYAILFALNLPWIEQTNSEKFIPQHVNLDQHANIMSFHKGCYLGQEIIARMKFLGTIKKRMQVEYNNNKDELAQHIDADNQVSPIIQLADASFAVQVIKAL